jgi:hypothetical protein
VTPEAPWAGGWTIILLRVPLRPLHDRGFVQGTQLDSEQGGGRSVRVKAFLGFTISGYYLTPTFHLHALYEGAMLTVAPAGGGGRCNRLGVGKVPENQESAGTRT